MEASLRDLQECALPGRTPDEIGYRVTDDGREVSLLEMIFNVRVCVGRPDTMVYDRGFCYPKDRFLDAIWALISWDGDGDPPGEWIKESGTNRYRVPGIGQDP